MEVRRTSSKVADLTIDEFRELVRAVVIQTLSEILNDPDEGLELRDDFAEELQYSLTVADADSKTVSAQKIAEKLGLTW